jgi:hypothetical protein
VDNRDEMDLLHDTLFQVNNEIDENNMAVDDIIPSPPFSPSNDENYLRHPIYGPVLPPNLRFTGIIPAYLLNYHKNDVYNHQSKSTLDGTLDPDERSQYFVRKQQAMLKEIFYIDDMYASLSSGDLEIFIAAVKEGYNNKRVIDETHSSALQIEQEEFERVIHAFMDNVALSHIQKIELLLILRKFGHEKFPKDPRGLKNRFKVHIDKAFPSQIIRRLFYPVNWGVQPSYNPIYDSRNELLTAIVTHMVDPRLAVIANKNDIHYSQFTSRDEKGNRKVTCGMDANYSREMLVRASKLPGYKDSDLVIGVYVYADGIALGWSRKQFPCYALLDCYGSNINKRHLGKINIGMIHDFYSKSEKLWDMIGRHGSDGLSYLGGKGLNKTRREESTKAFKSECQQLFFQELSDELLYSFNVGIFMFVPSLGYRTVRFYLKGLNADQPGMHDMLLMKRGPLRGCQNCCCYVRNTSDVYCPTIHCQRNYQKQFEMLTLVQSLVDKYEKGLPHLVTNEEKNAKNWLDNWGLSYCRVHPGFSNAPIASVVSMGLAEVSYRDLFHDIMAGIFPSQRHTLFRIVDAFSKFKSTRNKNALSDLDTFTSAAHVPRASSVPEFDHMEWNSYAEGLVSLMYKEDNDKGALGSGAHLKSGWATNQNLQLLMAIGPWGNLIPNVSVTDILPRQSNKKASKTIQIVQLPNPSELITNSILSAISYLMEMYRKEWNTKLVKANEKRVRAMCAYNSNLFHMMATLRWHNKTNPTIQLEMGKWHSCFHVLHHPMNTGCMHSASCSSFESYHRLAVSGLFDKTSQRFDTIVKEMASRQLEQKVQQLDTVARKMIGCSSITDFLKGLNEQDAPSLDRPEATIIEQASNGASSRSTEWDFSTNNSELRLYMHLKCVPEFKARMLECIPRRDRQSSTFKVVTAFSYRGSEGTLCKKAILYCSPYNGRFGRSRYSAVSFTHEGKINLGVCVGAVFVKVRNKKSSILLLHISRLDSSTEDVIPTWWPFQRFKHGIRPDNIIVIRATQLVDHIFLYPDFKGGVTSILDKTELSETERYWLIPRQLFERTGIKEICRDSSSDDFVLLKDFFDTSVGDSVEIARNYLQTQQSRGLAGIKIKPIPVYGTVPKTHSQDS